MSWNGCGLKIIELSGRTSKYPYIETCFNWKNSYTYDEQNGNGLRLKVIQCINGNKKLLRVMMAKHLLMMLGKMNREIGKEVILNLKQKWSCRKQMTLSL